MEATEFVTIGGVLLAAATFVSAVAARMAVDARMAEFERRISTNEVRTAMELERMNKTLRASIKAHGMVDQGYRRFLKRYESDLYHDLFLGMADQDKEVATE